ncbi:matrix metalloproteinase-28 [Seriola dumerili]|uniref:Matrix metallopeptidase 28 n=1 Tax=Seriola dumerili TaxID=41447 RepID=A0A3B4T1R1_SERDU|nr:matrix metalloproteinase-28 [Seriola dumerili]XP_022604152.1 matrix metalloproteinase-28 [Seriola dumerili]XP_022604153.1 matrix metalloproteinase-28 [Seriola dumerili]XP_022604154.1 matrix metalloproteinase-28 [Seriola dumerili]
MSRRPPDHPCGAGREMRAAWILTVCALVTAQTAGGSPLIPDPEVFLEKYGYLHQDNHIHNTVEVQSAIREFQWLSRLPVTGELDGATLRQMAEPRCGVSDEGSQQIWAQRVNAIFTGKRAAAGRPQSRRKRSAAQAEKWYKRHLTYQIVNWPRHLSLGSVRLAVRAAFQLWSNVSGLVFQEAPEGPADIRLAFYEGDHNDGASNAFDGPGGTLAHAFLPRRGEAHFDMAERWTLNGHKGHNLFMVTAHEIGHTLGLEHSPVRNALMSPYYRKLGRSLVLSWDDIIAVQQLYGKPSGDRPVRLPGQVLHATLQEWETTELKTTGQPLYCQGIFDAITMDQNDTVLVFRGSMYWTVSAEGRVSGPLPLRQRWSDLPPAIEAATFSPLDSKWYFFKGKRMWRYNDSVLDPGFPRKSSDLGLPRHPDCAFFYTPLGHMVLFKGSRYSVLNLKTLRQEPYYPRRLTDWTGVPQGTNGVLTRPGGRLYLFREQRFWTFDPVKVRVTREGQWAKDLSWTGCRNTLQSNNIL